MGEWSHQKLFYRDPIYILPTELLSQIFQLVDLRTVFRCHRVSKDWRTILSSYDIIQGLFQSWFCYGNQATLDFRETPAPIASAMAAHIDAFRTGDPFAMTTKLRDNYAEHEMEDVTAAYYDGILAWSENKKHTTNLLCLRTGRVKLWANDGRTTISRIAVSELLVATCNYFAKVLVYNHLTNDEYTFTISSANVKGFALSHITLAVFHDCEITVWSLTTQRTRQIPIISDTVRSLGFTRQKLALSGLQFASNGRDFICCNALVHDASPGTITFTRVSSEGESPKTSTAYDISSQCETICHRTPRIYPKGFHTFGAIVCDKDALLIGYDEFRNQPQFHFLGPSNRRWLPIGFFQKNMLYKGELYPDEPIRGTRKISLRVCMKDLHDLRDQHNIPWETIEMERNTLVKTEMRSWCGYKILGDDTFMVHMYPTHIVVYCFDQNSAGGCSWTKLRPSFKAQTSQGSSGTP